MTNFSIDCEIGASNASIAVGISKASATRASNDVSATGLHGIKSGVSSTKSPFVLLGVLA
jgi:hypothetical protein